jgi:hypothetical protein
MVIIFFFFSDICANMKPTLIFHVKLTEYLMVSFGDLELGRIKTKKTD